MVIRPKLSYKLLGTSLKLDSTQVYRAIDATNQPDWEERGKIFVQINNNDSMLLESGEYEVMNTQAHHQDSHWNKLMADNDRKDRIDAITRLRKKICNFHDKSWTDNRYAIYNEYGLLAIVYADCESDALDEAVDSGHMDSQLMSTEDQQEYEREGWEDSFCYAGNASEAIWTEHMAIQEV